MRMLRRFRTQLMLLAIAMVAIAVMCTAEISTASFIDTLWEQDSAAISAQSALVEEQILDLLNNANHCMSVIQRRESVLNFFLRRSRSTDSTLSSATAMIHELIDTIGELRNIDGVLFIQNNRIYGASTYWNFSGADVPDTLADLLEGVHETYSINWIGTYPLQLFTNAKLTGSPQISADYLVGVSHLRYTTLNVPVEITTLTLISTDRIDEVLQQIGAGSGDVTLIDDDGNIIAGDNIELDRLIFTHKHGEIDYSDGNADYRAFYYRISSKGWTIVRRMDIDTYQHQAADLRRKSYLTGIIAIAAMILLYSIIARLFFKPFQQVMGLFKQVQTGNLNARLKPFKRHILPVADEIQTMRTQLNSMLDSIGTLIADTERANRECAEIEVQSLQRQLNPHMIFNTLTSIRWMIMLHGDNWPGSESVDAMLREFAALLQPLFDDMRPEWTLHEELEHIGHYMQLLRMRYCAEFTMVNDAPDEMNDFLIPRFVLQPILENSCEHGIAGSHCLRVELHIELAGDFLRITVSDNGCGIAAEKLDDLRARLSGKESSEEVHIGRSGIGLINVDKQLRLHFGDNSGITIESTPSRGARVVLSMSTHLTT